MNRRNQQGAVLIVSLLFLVILTMLGITAMTGTTFEERMAGNARDAAVAHHAAEAALRQARDEILGLGVTPRDLHMSVFSLTDPLSTDGLCDRGICQPRFYDKQNKGAILPEVPQNLDWTDATSTKYGSFSNAKTLTGLPRTPRYIIEFYCLALMGGGIDASDKCRVFRFTAVGWGRNPNTQVSVQEVYIAEKAGK